MSNHTPEARERRRRALGVPSPTATPSATLAEPLPFAAEERKRKALAGQSSVPVPAQAPQPQQVTPPPPAGAPDFGRIPPVPLPESLQLETGVKKAAAREVARGIERLGSLFVPGDLQLPFSRRAEDDILRSWGYDPKIVRDNPSHRIRLKENGVLTHVPFAGLLGRAQQAARAPASPGEMVGQIIGGVLTFGVAQEPLTTAQARGPLETAVGAFPQAGVVAGPILAAAPRAAAPAIRVATAGARPAVSAGRQAIRARTLDKLRGIPGQVRQPVTPLEAPAVTRAVEPPPLVAGKKFTLFKESDAELGEAMLAAAEEGGAEGVALGPVRRLQIFDNASGEPLLAIAARRVPTGGRVFEVEMRGLGLGGKALEFTDPSLRGQFSRRELFEIADDVMRELKADELIGFRLGRETGIKGITRSQVDRALSTPARTVPVTPSDAPARAGEIAVSGKMLEDGKKLSLYMYRTGREKGLTSGPIKSNIQSLQAVRSTLKKEKSGSIGVPSRPGAPFPGAEMRALPGFKETTGLTDEFSSWATKAGLSNTDPRYASDALWLYEAKRIKLDPNDLIRKYPASFPTVKTPERAAAQPVAPAISPVQRTQLEAVRTIPAGGSPARTTSSELVDDLLFAHLDAPEAQTRLRRVAESLEDVWGVGAVVRSANPSAVARTNPALREGIGYRLLEQVQDAQLSIKLAAFAERVPFRADRQGRVTVGDVTKAFGDIAESPSLHSLNRDQSRWLNEAYRYIDDLAVNYENVSGKAIRTQLAKERFWPRFVRRSGREPRVQGRVGARLSPAQERVLEYMEDGLEIGVPYETSPLEQLRLYGRALQKMTRDEILLKRLEAKGLSRPIKEGKLHRGEVIPEEFSSRVQDAPVFSEETARILKSPLGRPTRALRFAEIPTGVVRQLVTGLMDTGQFLIQGLTLLAHSPRGWSRAVWGSLRAIANPKSFTRWLATSPQARRAAEFGLDAGAPSEFFQAAPIIGRIPGVGAVARRVQAGFEAFLGMGRVSMFDGMADAAIAARHGDDELFRLARMVDTLMGTTATKSLGVSATQRQVENAFMFFSPRYTRSIYGTLAYMFGKGFGPQQTRKIMAKMLFGGAAMYAGIAKASGMSDKEITEGLNPQSGKRFMSIKIGDSWFGIGGAYRSMLAFLGDMADKDSWDFDSWYAKRPDQSVAARFAVGTLEAGKWNPVARYLRSRTSPLTGTISDFIAQEDFIGRPMTTRAFAEKPSLFVDQLIQRSAPFPIQAFLELQGGVKERLTGAGVEALGARVSPQTFTDVADQVAQEMNLGGRYRDLEPYQKDDVEENPHVQRVAQNRAPQGVFATLEEIDAKFDQELEGLVKRTKQGFIQHPNGTMMVKGAPNWKRFITDAYFTTEAARANQKEGARAQAGITFRDPETEGQQDLNKWHSLADIEKEREGVLLLGALEQARTKFEREIGRQRFRYVIRNAFLREVPEEIKDAFSPNGLRWRNMADKERKRHRAEVRATR